MKNDQTYPSNELMSHQMANSKSNEHEDNVHGPCMSMEAMDFADFTDFTDFVQIINVIIITKNDTSLKARPAEGREMFIIMIVAVVTVVFVIVIVIVIVVVIVVNDVVVDVIIQMKSPKARLV